MSIIKRKMDEETKQKISESLKKYWENKKLIKDRGIKENYTELNIKPFYRLSKEEQQAKKERLKKMVKLMEKGELARSLESGLL
jgi:hypothetical protein